METSDPIKFYSTFDTTLNADSIEWCPVRDYHHYVLCGAYQLDEAPNKEGVQTRNGYFQIHELNKNSTPTLIPREKVETFGVLDIKWSQSDQNRPIFGLVDAGGCAQFFVLEDFDGKCEKVGEVCVEDGGLGLSVDWSEESVVTSTSKGCLAVVDVESGFKVVNKWCAHEFEAWTCAFDRGDRNLVYSGGDDCKFKAWDLRTNPIHPFRSINKIHSMGVTNITANPTNPNIICTGSYDEHLREWDTRLLIKPLQEIKIGGGIWRIKYSPFDSNHVAMAAMHNGVHIVSLKDPKNHFRFTRHESMAYGIDWCHERLEKNHFLLTSCSFYDHSMKLWSWTNDCIT